MKVYDKDGKEHERYSVDARELVEFCGWTVEPPAKKKQGKKKTTEAK